MIPWSPGTGEGLVASGKHETTAGTCRRRLYPLENEFNNIIYVYAIREWVDFSVRQKIIENLLDIPPRVHQLYIIIIMLSNVRVCVCMCVCVLVGFLIIERRSEMTLWTTRPLKA